MKRKSRGQIALEATNNSYAKPRPVSDTATVQPEITTIAVDRSAPIYQVADVTDPVTDALTFETDVMYKYKYLKVTIAALKSKTQKPTWSRVQECVQQLLPAGVSFTLDDVALLLHISPDDFKLTWQVISKKASADLGDTRTNSSQHDIELVFIDDQANNRSMANSHASKLEDFRAKLVALLPQLADPEYRVNNVIWSIPPKPSMNEIDPVSQSIREVSRVATAQRQQQKQDLKSQLSAVGISGLDGLKEFARQRGETRTISVEEVEVATRERSRLQALPALGDALRSLALSSRRSNCTSKELIEQLAPQLRITTQELQARLELLVMHAPEFLTVIPPDDIVDVETLRVNLQAPFTEVRRKLAALIAEDSKKAKTS